MSNVNYTQIRRALLDSRWSTQQIGEATIRFDSNSRRFSISAPGFAPRSTRSMGKAADLVCGLM